MAIDFPNNPSVAQKFSSGGYQWSFDGAKWNAAGGAGSPDMTFLPLTGGTLASPGDLLINGSLANGVTPPADLLTGNALFYQIAVTSSTGIANNAYYNDTSIWKYLGTGPATAFNMDAGNFTFFSAPSGTAGATPAWTQTAILDASGTLTLTNMINAAGGLMTGRFFLASLPLGGGQLRLLTSNTASTYGVILRNDGANFYFLLTNNNDALGTWNGLRPFMINLPTGNVTFGQNVTVSGGLTCNSGLIANNGIAVANAQWFYGTTTTGAQIGLATLWNNNLIYLGFGDRPLYVQGIPVYLGDNTGTVAAFGRSDVQSLTYANFIPTRWRLAVGSGDEPSAGSIDYRGFDASALNIVGAGTAGGNRWVRIFDNLLATLLQSNGDVNAAGYLRSTAGHCVLHSATNNVDWQMYVDSDVFHIWRAGVGDILYTGNDGNGWLRGGWSLNGGVTATGELYSTHSLATAGYLWINGAQFYLATDNWLYCTASFRAYDFQSNNNVYAAGNITAAGALYAGGLIWYNWTGWMRCTSNVYSDGQFNGDTLNARGSIYFAGCSFYNADGWVATNQPLKTASIFQALATGVNSAFFANGTGGDAVFYANNGGMSAYGFNNLSDARLKQNITDSDIGLKAILALAPKIYNRIDTPEREELGLIAQDVASVLPQAVVTIEYIEPDMLGTGEIIKHEPRLAINYAQITTALINAVKELSAELVEVKAQLENR
jgi:hypothetical protein